MKFTLPTFIALISAMPVFSTTEIANPLNLVVVTSWDEGSFDRLYAPLEGKTKFLVDDKMYNVIYVGDSYVGHVGGLFFNIRRPVWPSWSYWVSSLQMHTDTAQCDVSVVKDPGVPIVHIILEGDGDDFKYRANKHEEEVTVVCNRRENL